MKIASTCVAAVTSTVILSSSAAFAATLTPGSYFLLDHPDGQLNTQDYGLRLDILDPPSGVGPTFSVQQNGASAILNWDGGSTATITGTMLNNATGNLWSVEHNLTGVSAVGGPNGGFSATGGTLTATVAAADQSLYGANVYTFFSVPAGGDAFLALGDDHRCGKRPDCGPLIARGWLNLSGEPLGSGGATVEDWLVQLTPVPLPAGVWLLLGGLALTRRSLGRSLA